MAVTILRQSPWITGEPSTGRCFSFHWRTTEHQKCLASSKGSVNCWMLVPYRQRRPNRVSAPDTDECRDVRHLSREPHDWGLFNSTFFIIHWKRKAVPDRNLPAPWSSEEHSAYHAVFYYENETRYRAKFPTKDEARRVALNIARLPELLRYKT